LVIDELPRGTSQSAAPAPSADPAFNQGITDDDVPF
jgi:hypothetical protein